MATKKITELPLIQTISGSYSVVPIVIGNVVGSGTTDQISIENFSRFVTAYSAHTGSAGNTFTGPQTINNNVTINGKLTVTELVATYETASIIYSEGGNIFGNELTDKQQLTGSVNITGSLIYNNVLVTNIDANTINRLQQTTASLNTFTSSQADRNLVLSTVTGSINQATASIQFQTASLLAFTASQDSRNFTLSQVTGSFNYFYQATASLQAFTASQADRNLVLSIVTGSINQATASLQFHSASVEAQLARIQQATASLELASASFNYFYQSTASLQAFTASQADRNLVLSIVTGSINQATASLQFESASVKAQLGRVYQTTASLHDATASLQFHSASVNSQLLRIQQATASIQAQTASLLAFTASQDSRNLTLSTVTGSLIGITNGLMAFTAALDNTYATDAQLYQLYQATQSLELHSGSIIGITNQLMALTASMKAQAIVSSSQQITNYYKFAETASANTTFYGGINVTDYSKFGKSGVAKTLDIFGGVSVTGSVTTQANSIGGFIGNFYNQWDSFGSQGGDGAASVGYFVGTFNDDRKLRLLSDADILLTTGINKKIQVAKASVGTSKVEITGSFNVTGSSTTVGNFEVLNGNMIGSLLATNNVVSSSTQISNYYKFAETASANTTFYGGLTVTDYSKFGKSGVAKALDIFGGVSVTGSVITQQNTIGGFVGSYYLQWDSFGSQGGDAQASVGYFIGASNDDRKLRITSDRDIQLNHGNGVGRKIQIPRTGIGLGSVVELTGSLNITGSSTIVGDLIVTLGGITGSILATNGVLSGSAQIGELTQIAGIEAYTASLKGAAIVSSSQQITNYYKFAETASANTVFYGNVTASGNLHANQLYIGGATTASGLFGASEAVVQNELGIQFADATGTYMRLIANTANSNTAIVAGAFSGAQPPLDLIAGGITAISVKNDGGINFSGALTASIYKVNNGGGIDFSATSNGSGTMTSELLNDYEEGTWTPVITDLTNDATMDGTYTRGSYIKIGKQVTVRGYILTTSLGSITGNVKIKGLPFTNGGGFANLGGGSIGTAGGLNITAGHSVHISTPIGANYLGINVGDDAGGTTEMTAAEWSADGQVQMLATYFVD